MSAAGLLVSGKYVNPFTERQYPRVTSIVGVKSKPALVPWAAKVTAECAFEMRDALCANSKPAAIQMLKAESKRVREIKANLGTEVHAALRALVAGEEYVGRPEFPVDKHVAQFQRFLADWSPTFVMTETYCFSDEFNYAGTFDAIVELPGLGRFVVDYKTGGLYAEAALQVCAYSRADYVVVGPPWEQHAMPALDGGLVLRITADDYELRTLATDDDVFDTFLFCAGIVEFDARYASKVIGQPLVKVTGDAAPPVGGDGGGGEAPAPVSGADTVEHPPSLATARTTLRDRLTTMPKDYTNKARIAWKKASLPPLTSDEHWNPQLLDQADLFVKAWEIKVEDEHRTLRIELARRLDEMGVKADVDRHAWVTKFNGKAGLRECTVAELRAIDAHLQKTGSPYLPEEGSE